MKPLHSLLILPFFIINALGLSPVAVPDISSSTYENRTFNHNVIQAFARLNGTWSPKIRSYTTLEDLVNILSWQWAFLGNTTKSSAYTDRRSHHVHSPSLRRHHHHGLSLEHRSSHSTRSTCHQSEGAQGCFCALYGKPAYICDIAGSTPTSAWWISAATLLAISKLSIIPKLCCPHNICSIKLTPS